MPISTILFRFLQSGLVWGVLVAAFPTRAQSISTSPEIDRTWYFLHAEAGMVMAKMGPSDRPSWWPDRIACRGIIVDFWGGGTYLLAGFESNGSASVVAVSPPSSLNFFQAAQLLSRSGSKDPMRMATELPVKWRKVEVPVALLDAALHAFQTKTKDPKYDNLLGPYALDPVTFIADGPGRGDELAFAVGADSFLLGSPEVCKGIDDARVQTVWALRVLDNEAERGGSPSWRWAGSTGPNLKNYALGFAVEAKDREAIKSLLANGADPNAVTSKFPEWEAPTPLELAARNLDVESVRLLLKWGANAQGNPQSEAPLDGALLVGGYAPRGSSEFPNRATCLELVNQLLAAGADPKRGLECFQDEGDMVRDPVVLRTLEGAAARKVRN